MFKHLQSFSDRARNVIVVAATAIILAVVNVEIVSKERIVRDGAEVLLRIAPRDPRSLLQGDYMALRYSLSRDVATAAEQAQVDDGQITFRLADNGEAIFSGIYAGQPLAEGQLLLRFRKRGDSVRLASDAFFFEEGQMEVYSAARFGELRVNKDGAAVLTGLRDGDGNRLGESLHD